MPANVPSTVATAKSLWRLVIKFQDNDFPQTSCSMGYNVAVCEDDPNNNANLGTLTPPSATLALAIHQSLLPLNWQIVSASTSSTRPGNDSVVSVPVPLSPVKLTTESSAIEGENDPAVGFLYRFQAGTAHAYRVCKPLRDSHVTGFANVVSGFTDNISSFTLPTFPVSGGLTPVQLYQCWQYWVQNYTFWARKKRGIYTIQPFNSSNYFRTVTRHPAAPFGGRPTRSRS